MYCIIKGIINNVFIIGDVLDVLKKVNLQKFHIIFLNKLFSTLENNGEGEEFFENIDSYEDFLNHKDIPQQLKDFAESIKDRVINSVKDYNPTEITEKENIKDSGYRVITNIGENGGQEVQHLHFHILGGTISSSSSQRKEDLLINSLVERVKKDNIEEAVQKVEMALDLEDREKERIIKK